MNDPITNSPAPEGCPAPTGSEIADAGHAPKTFWEDRAANAEGALERVMDIVARHLPATRPELESVAKEWTRIRLEIEKEYSQNDQVEARRK